ncbi:DMT family transporter [Solimonas sp. K1W22B-7]|uniref:DMT family transporter n=1 Tax=Solimonas sp. K1W22B-7 TaxID=2303331 RepID=UPI0019690AFC|nr:DMT family transporter [Solimonas sp. K1W22B-7]
MSLRLSPLSALLIGATLIGLAPIFVRLADVGPTATAFWRLALAAPVFGLLMLLRGESFRGTSSRSLGWLALAGLFFVGDLAVWHQSILWTSVANSTLLTNLAPVWVTLVAWWLWGERVRPAFIAGLGLAFGGALLLMADSMEVSRRTLIGDLLSVVTSLFYAGYLLVLSHQRRYHSTLAVMFWTSATAAIVLLPMTLLQGEVLWPQSAQGWWVLLGLAMLSHVLGQGLIAYGFAHLPASFSSVSLLLQPLAAAAFAWLLLQERFGAQQALGGAIVLGGILWCRQSMKAEDKSAGS